MQCLRLRLLKTTESGRSYTHDPDLGLSFLWNEPLRTSGLLLPALPIPPIAEAPAEHRAIEDAEAGPALKLLPAPMRSPRPVRSATPLPRYISSLFSQIFLFISIAIVCGRRTGVLTSTGYTMQGRLR